MSLPTRSTQHPMHNPVCSMFAKSRLKLGWMGICRTRRVRQASSCSDDSSLVTEPWLTSSCHVSVLLQQQLHGRQVQVLGRKLLSQGKKQTAHNTAHSLLSVQKWHVRLFRVRSHDDYMAFHDGRPAAPLPHCTPHHPTPASLNPARHAVSAAHCTCLLPVSCRTHLRAFTATHASRTVDILSFQLLVP